MIIDSLYNLSMYLMRGGLYVLSPFNSKANKLLRGNKKVFKKLSRHFSENPGKYIWFHCASLGEFEQGRPVIERFRQEKPDYKILLTFFSPSGYEIQKDFERADIISYLPLDTSTNARKFIGICKPEIAVFVKYEFWLHYLKELGNQGIPVISISSVFRPDQLFFKKYGGFYKGFLNYFEHFFVQDELSFKLLRDNGYSNVTIAGDSRFDRVLEISRRARSFSAIETFSKGHRIMVIGSSWPEDLELLFPLFSNNDIPLKYIIAPHETDTYHILKVKKTIGQPLTLFTKARNTDLNQYKFMVIDTIGLLSSLYKYGDIAYVGGAFGKGLHNILEPAVFGNPVFFGKGQKNEKYLEAAELVKAGGGFEIETSTQLIKKIKHLLKDSMAMRQAGNASRQYIASKSGATETIIGYLSDKLK